MQHEGQWLKYKYGEVWEIDSITLPQACQVMAPVSATLDLNPTPLQLHYQEYDSKSHSDKSKMNFDETTQSQR